MQEKRESFSFATEKNGNLLMVLNGISRTNLFLLIGIILIFSFGISKRIYVG